MTKQIIVNACDECPYSWLNENDNNWYCEYKRKFMSPGRIISGENYNRFLASKFPKFCKLKDYENNRKDN